MIDTYGDPGTPDGRGGARYLWWLVRRQPGRCLAGAVYGSVWMVLLASTPYLMSRRWTTGWGRATWGRWPAGPVCWSW